MKGFRFAVVAILLALALGFARPAVAEPLEQQILIDKAQLSIEAMMADQALEAMHTLIKDAKGIVIVPNLVKVGFILGGAGGSGVLMIRNVAKNDWSNPAFVDFGAASIGIQAGVQVSDLVLLVMTDNGLEALLSNKVTLGAEAGLVVGTIGGEREAATTTNLDADIFAFSRSIGLFGGLSLEGGMLIADEEWNAAYYGRPATTREIVLEQAVSNPEAGGLRLALFKLSS